MKILSTTRRLVPLAAALCLALPGPAQDVSRPYVPFKIDPDYQNTLRNRLAMEQQLGPFKDLVKQIMADPGKMALDPTKMKDMKLEDPEFKKALQDWLANDPKLRQSLVEWLVQNPPDKQPADVKKLQQDVKQLLDEPAKAPADTDGNPAAPNKAEPTGAPEDPLAKLAEQAMKQTERGKLGEWLRESPAWQQAFADLRASLEQKDGKLGDWQTRLLTPDANTWRLAEGTLDRLRAFPRPNLDGFQWEWSAPGIGAFAAPDLGAPEMADLHGPGLSTGATWVLLALLCLLIGWRLLRWNPRSAPARGPRPDLGPWPVRPEAVATRAELVQAFDYLALWTLGLEVKSWNHHAVAARWREKSPCCADSAAPLARLYEWARYTDGAEVLADAPRQLARRCLLQLAEAF